MKFVDKDDFEKQNVFGTGQANTAYAKYFIGDSFLDDVVGSFRFGFSKSIFLSHRPSQELLAEKDEYRDVKYIRIHSYRDLIRL